jgi:hypothetical protein
MAQRRGFIWAARSGSASATRSKANGSVRRSGNGFHSFRRLCLQVCGRKSVINEGQGRMRDAEKLLATGDRAKVNQACVLVNRGNDVKRAAVVSSDNISQTKAACAR